MAQSHSSADHTAALLGTPQPGELLAGKYRIERVIGIGGMGVVLSALHEELGERVAIKCLLPALANDTVFVARFQREARAAVKIRSEHIARVLDVAKSDTGAPFIVMEYLEGEDLGSLLDRRSRLPASLAIGYVLQACEALAEAHALGIVHRDLKPENLFLTNHADGSECVKVMDFGISKMADAGPDNLSLTRTGGGVMGSPLYMAPEQMRSTKDADPRTDIWALGAMLFEFISGEPPFLAASIQEIVAMIVQDTTPSLAQRAAGRGIEVSPQLDAAVARALQKRPDERYADVAELALALAPFGDEEARASASRIGRVLERRARAQASGSFSRLNVVPASTPAVAPVAAPSRREGIGTQSAATWTDVKPAGASRSRTLVRIALAAFAVALVVVLVAFGLGRTSQPPMASLPPSDPSGTAPSAASSATSASLEAPSLPSLGSAVAAAPAVPSDPPADAAGTQSKKAGMGARLPLPEKKKKPDPGAPPVPAAPPSAAKPGSNLASSRHD